MITITTSNFKTIEIYTTEISSEKVECMAFFNGSVEVAVMRGNIEDAEQITLAMIDKIESSFLAVGFVNTLGETTLFTSRKEYQDAIEAERIL